MPLHIHFVGIKGTGVSALAQVSAKVEGAIVTGSDVKERFFTDIVLERAGIPVYPFAPENVENVNLVVASAAYNETNVEIARAHELNIPVLSYPQYLGQMMAGKRGIAIAGTHGKTTTTAMAGLVLIHAGIDPTIVVGSDVPSIGGNAYAGQGEYFLAESCEYRRHFLNYSPEYMVITNIEFDHPDYFSSLDDVVAAFREFARKLPPHGRLFMWAEDPHRSAIESSAPVTTFGLSSAADVQAVDVSFHDEGSSMRILRHGQYIGDLHLRVTGRHNILNALATIALCAEIGVPVDRILSTLGQFNGTKRRFEHIGSKDGALIVDDYAHHPTEIRTTLEGARLSFPQRRIRAIFQPHTFSRTASLLEEFSHAFRSADEVVIAEIFASAREQDLNSISALALAELIQKQGINTRFFSTLDDIKTYVAETLAPEDLVLTLGAGDVYKVGQGLVC